MKRGVFVIDTNVVVSGLMTSTPESPVAVLLDGMLAATFPFVISEALLAEYHSVLARPALRKVHGLTHAEIESVLLDIARHAIVIQPVAGLPAPDPGDQLLWDLLGTKPDLILVTGDKLLLRDRGMKRRVMTPADVVIGR